MNDDITASFIDKTDWRITLHRKLEACVDAEGTFQYGKAVKRLVSAASATYPGWNAEEQIKVFIRDLEKDYNEIWDSWISKNQTKTKHSKDMYESYLKYLMNKDIFNFIKNMCARKRMLLWGSKRIPGGTQMPYDDE